MTRLLHGLVLSLADRRAPRVAAFLLACAGLAALAAPAAAQFSSFGKNKVQYTAFAWRVLESDHFDLYFYPEEDSLAHTALRIAEEAYAEIAGRFRHEVERRIPLIIYSSHQAFEQTNLMPYFLPEGVAGFTEYLKGRVAIPYNGNYYDFERVIRHELVHVFQLSRMAELSRLHYRASMPGPPLWFTEGMAEVWSGDWDSTGELFVSDLVLNELLPPIRDLWRFHGSFVNYKIGQDLVMWLEANFGPDVVPALYEELWRSRNFHDALERVTETPLAVLDEHWHHGLERRFYPQVQVKEPLALSARALATKGGANFQAAVPPAGGSLDPDTYFFVSPRTGWMSIYRGSTRGEEQDVKRLLTGGRAAQFESFHGFESRMSVSRDGRLAFVSKDHDRDGLFVYDVEKGEVVGTWQFEGLVSLRSPTFRPDGGAVVFAGLNENGRQDLYLFELGGESLAPLTADRYYDDDPAWSPDGETLAFVSDRSPWGEAGAQNIFLLDFPTGLVRPATFGPSRDRAPSWSPDGGRLAYSSDREGVPQIYVADSAGVSVRVTSFLGGAYSPVWLPGGEEFLFTALSNQRFGVYRARAEARGEPLPPPEVLVAPGPPLASAAGADSLGYPQPLPPAWKWRVEADSLVAQDAPFRSRFTMDFAQGGVVLEATERVGEGFQAIFSDQLGDHVFYVQFSNTALEMSDLLSRTNLGLTYMNLRRRFNYGASAFHFASDFRDELGRPYFERRTGATGIVAYPFSKYFRTETSFGLVYSDREADSFRPARRAVLAVNYLSFIHDTSLWSNTGPMDGSRYNLSLGLNTNLDRMDVENASASLDVRHYFRTGLRTAYAVRFLGSVSHGSLPRRFVMGGSWSLRGYPRRSLYGTRLALLNQEWRFPLLHGAVLGSAVGNIGLPGVQGALFFDVGNTWEEERSPQLMLGSFGLGLRANLAGFVVLRLDFCKLTDFERIQKGTVVDLFMGFNY